MNLAKMSNKNRNNCQSINSSIQNLSNSNNFWKNKSKGQKSYLTSWNNILKIKKSEIFKI